MKKAFRIKRNEEFQKIIGKGKFRTNRTFVMYYSNSEKKHDRIGISVGKKLGNAVQRNKVKRQVRTMIDEVCDFNQGLDLIIIVRKNFAEYDYQTNKKYLSALCSSVYNKHNDELK